MYRSASSPNMGSLTSHRDIVDFVGVCPGHDTIWSYDDGTIDL